MEVAVGAHKLADGLTSDHRFTLGAQIRRSSTSVPSNIAEGHAHRGNRIFLRHVRIAIGSIAELDTQIEIVVRLRLVGELASAELLNEIVRTRQMLYGLEKALARRLIKSVATAIGTLAALASCFALLI
jgi:four helix bundle protein